MAPGPRTKLAKRAVELPTSPHNKRKINSVRIAQPDQMCQSVWWYVADHQLKTINAASSQWQIRVGRSQTA
jgi:hypothetical protein